VVFLTPSKLALIGYALAFSLCSMAAEQPLQDLDIQLKTEIPTLTASPGLCEFRKGQTSCQMQATLLWETPRAGHYCIWDSEGTAPLACWQDSWSGTHTLKFISARSRTYWLTVGEQGGIAASTSISVSSGLEQRMKAKRRRGFWRVF